MKEAEALDKAIKGWMTLKCPHCRKLNPLDTLKCIYCGHFIRVKAGLGCEQE